MGTSDFQSVPSMYDIFSDGDGISSDVQPGISAARQPGNILPPSLFLQESPVGIRPLPYQ